MQTFVKHQRRSPITLVLAEYPIGLGFDFIGTADAIS
jgi:hypothetical protein